jgi:small subunit ribosomal protein S6
MASDPQIYDLTLLLSTEASEETRAKVLSDVETAIQRGGGSVVNKSAMGTRNLAYPINREGDAEFHLLQITAPGALLTDLGQNLRITDGVLRFRIIKAIPGSHVGAAREPARAGGREQAGASTHEPAGASSAEGAGANVPEPAGAGTGASGEPDTA